MNHIKTTLAVKVIRRGLLLACLCLTSLSASASHIPGFGFFGEDFTFDGTAYGGGAAFAARNINFNYDSEIDQSLTAAPLIFDFLQTGIANFSAFFPAFGAPIGAGISGLGLTYNMYATFESTGSTDFTGVGGGGAVDGFFSSFIFEMWIDAAMDTTFTPPATNGPASESMAVTGSAGDDVSILMATLDVGGFHVFSGLAAGDFDVLLNVISFDATVFGGAAFATSTQADFNGVNSSVTGVSPAAFIDGTTQGSGNALFSTIPEPSSIALLGLAMFGLSLATRRKAG
jgi:hypothetical protein